jgi:hypothetical protein
VVRILRSSIAKFIRAIKSLPPDPPVVNPKKWYTTQKEHWLGWLGEYHTAGAYGRQTSVRRDAEYAYNHVVQVEMLLYLIDAARVDRKLVTKARSEASRGKTLMQKSALVRKVVPWSVIAEALWPE